MVVSIKWVSLSHMRSMLPNTATDTEVEEFCHLTYLVDGAIDLHWDHKIRIAYWLKKDIIHVSSKKQVTRRYIIDIYKTLS